MNVGKELDALVAEKVMGWKLRADYSDRWIDPIKKSSATLPFYSLDLYRALEVVEKLPYRFALIKERDGSNERRYKAFFTDGNEGFPVQYAQTAAHAICLAALKTLELGDSA